MSIETNYLSEATDDARETARNYRDAIVEKAMDDPGSVSDDLNNDYDNGDAWHHKNHVDREYSLSEAADLLDQLSSYEETDSGLWEGQSPREAISTQAAFTYGSAVYSEWERLIESTNDDYDLTELVNAYDSIEDVVDKELSEHKDADGEIDVERTEQDPSSEIHMLERDPSEYEPPFDRDDEVERRQAAQGLLIEARVDWIIEMFC